MVFFRRSQNKATRFRRRDMVPVMTARSQDDLTASIPMIIDGKRVSARSTFSVINPSTGVTFADVAAGDIRIWKLQWRRLATNFLPGVGLSTASASVSCTQSATRSRQTCPR